MNGSVANHSQFYQHSLIRLSCLCTLMRSACFQQDTGAQRLTALMYAALTGNREAVDTLLRLGADPDILDSEGETALFCALQAGDLVITERLALITTKGEAHGGN